MTLRPWKMVRVHLPPWPSPPWPPPPRIAYVADSVVVPNVPGVYFLYDLRLSCKYVGQSVSLQERLKGHPHLEVRNDVLAWITFRPGDLLRAEAYYIGLLQPYLNFGGDAAFLEEIHKVRDRNKRQPHASFR